MDIVDFAEKIIGINLLECQKELLRSFEKVPRDRMIINSRRGYMIVVPRKEKENGRKI